MTFRVTPHRSYEVGQLNAQSRYALGAALNVQVSTGVRVHKPSDDPSAQKTILNQNSILSRLDALSSVVSTTRTTLSESNQHLLDAQQLLVQAKEIAMQARDEQDPTVRQTFVSQLDGILTQLDVIANAQSNGEYLFSGTSLQTKPYSGIAAGQPVYQGSSGPATAHVAGGETITVNNSGQRVFQPTTSGSLVVFGNTGVKNGSGVSTGSATTQLTVRHTGTVYSGGSGIQAGTSSVGGDTILGSTGTHRLTITDTSGTGASGTISLNGGESVSFTSADTDLRITGPNGEVIFINTQSITAGFNGTIDLTGNGTLSIDGGLTEVPIDFSGNQIVTSSLSSSVQSFDTTNVSRAGSASVQPAETADLFQSVIALRDTLLNTHQLSAEEQDRAFALRLQDLDLASNHLLTIIGEQSVSLQNLDRTDTRLAELKLSAQTVLSNAQGTDYFAAVSQLQEQQTLLQFTMQSLTMMSSVSLVDFLN